MYLSQSIMAPHRCLEPEEQEWVEGVAARTAKYLKIAEDDVTLTCGEFQPRGGVILLQPRGTWSRPRPVETIKGSLALRSIYVAA